MTTIDELIRRGDHAYTVHNYFSCTKEEWQTLKSAVLTQQPTNKQMVSEAPQICPACNGCGVDKQFGYPPGSFCGACGGSGKLHHS
jgi:hypothetical protein